MRLLQILAWFSAWTEDYLLRAFLQFSHALALIPRDLLAAHMPLCLKNPGGSIWLRKL